MQAIQNDDKNGTADYNQFKVSLYYKWTTLNKYNTFDLDTPRKYEVIIAKVVYLKFHFHVGPIVSGRAWTVACICLNSIGRGKFFFNRPTNNQSVCYFMIL